MPVISRRDIVLASLAVASTSLASAGLAFAAEPEPEPGHWDLSDLYPSDEAWDGERDAVAKALPGLAAHRGTLGQGAAALRDAFQAASDLNRRIDRLGVYAGLKADADTGLPAAQERRQRAITLAADFGEATAWINPEVLSLGADKVAAYEAAEPGLAKFRFGLADILRQAPHTLGPE